MSDTLFPVLLRLAQLQGEQVDRNVLQAAVHPDTDAVVVVSAENPRDRIKKILQQLQVGRAKWLKAPDPSLTPALLFHPELGWGILRGINGRQQWVSAWINPQNLQWSEGTVNNLDDCEIALLRLAKPYEPTRSPVFRLILSEILSHQKLLMDIALGSLLVNIIAVATSLYSMQVYDRVVPTGAINTLIVLTIGVILASIFEVAVKHVRSATQERLTNRLDQRLSRAVYTRFLDIRLDQMPASVGSLANQLRGYETVRGFLTNASAYMMVDVPFAIIFLTLIAAIGGWLALIPGIFFCLAIAIGLHFKSRVNALALKATAAGNFKTGLLVESVEGAETIKSGQGGWRMLSKWMNATDEARGHEQQMRNTTEHAQHAAALFQQVSYVGMVAGGALLVSKGVLTMGGLIACSILSSRVLAPTAAIPSQLMQWAHMKAALRSLDQIWHLPGDHDGLETPLLPENIQGSYQLVSVATSYSENQALTVSSLNITAGEKVGILGPIGAGKTTLLRNLTGMYKPQQGRILLDGMDLSQISKSVLAEHIGFLQQEGRLFAGTLRENLLIGGFDPGDTAILEAAKLTGLFQSTIGPHPKGLHRPIHEGGLGLSTGQRQLVNLTRIFLRKPNIWLLDEPTASMDTALEQHIILGLKKALRPQDTLVVVTHKQEMLALVDRLIVVANNQIVMDGPKAEVIKSLNARKSNVETERRAMTEGAAA